MKQSRLLPFLMAVFMLVVFVLIHQYEQGKRSGSTVPSMFTRTPPKTSYPVPMPPRIRPVPVIPKRVHKVVPITASYPVDPVLLPAMSAPGPAQPASFAELPETFDLEVIPTFNQRPIAGPLTGSFSASIYNWQSQKNVSVNLAPGKDLKLKFDRLHAGTCSVSLAYDADPGNPARYPGDYSKDMIVRVGPSSGSPLLVPMTKYIRLRKPVDNGTQLKDKVVTTDTIELAWDPIDGADSYQIRMSPNTFMFRPNTWVTTEPALIASMPPGVYQLQIDAMAASATIGTLLCHSSKNMFSPIGAFLGTVRGPFYVEVVPSATEPRSVVVLLRYKNQPYDLLPGTPVEARLRESEGRTSRSVPVVIGSQSVRIESLPPGHYRLELMIDSNQSNGIGGSGDLTGMVSVGVNRENVEVTMLLSVLMRLRYPENSDTPGLKERLERDELVEMGNPVTLAWDPISDTATYTWGLSPCGYGTTTATAIVVNVPPGQTINLSLSGNDASGTLGQLRIGYPNPRHFYPFRSGPAGK